MRAAFWMHLILLGSPHDPEQGAVGEGYTAPQAGALSLALLVPRAGLGVLACPPCCAVATAPSRILLCCLEPIFVMLLQSQERAQGSESLPFSRRFYQTHQADILLGGAFEAHGAREACA